jgi:hypothetical protein
MMLYVPLKPLGTFFVWLNVSPELLESQSACLISIENHSFNGQGAMTKSTKVGSLEK